MPKLENELIIWPVYIDATKSRAYGRMISRADAIPEPKIAEIAKAAEALGLHPRIEREKAYPKEWWQVSGRVIVEKTAPKSITLKNIARKIKEMRGK